MGRHPSEQLAPRVRLICGMVLPRVHATERVARRVGEPDLGDQPRQCGKLRGQRPAELFEFRRRRVAQIKIHYLDVHGCTPPIVPEYSHGERGRQREALRQEITPFTIGSRIQIGPRPPLPNSCGNEYSLSGPNLRFST